VLANATAVHRILFTRRAVREGQPVAVD
jgi:hypothetical protein